MIQRRQFLGSMAAICAVSSSFTPILLGAPVVTDLNWDCQSIQALPHHDSQRKPVVTGTSLRHDGKILAMVGDDHHVCIYDIDQQTFIQHLDKHRDWVRTAKFSPDGSLLATAGNDRTLLVWNTENWNRPAITKRHSEAIIDVAFSSDGKQIATVGFDSMLRIYDTATGIELNKLECPCPDMHAVAYSHDNQLIAAGGRCGYIRVWDVQSGKQVTQIKAHRQRIRSIEFTADRMIVSAGDDRYVHINDPTGVAPTRSLPRLSSKLYAVKLIENKWIATAGSDNQIHLWQISDLQKIGSLQGHTGTVTSLDYAADRLVSGSYDTHVRIWNPLQDASSTPPRHTELQQGWNQKFK